MNSVDLQRRIEEVKSRAAGHWGDILRRIGVDEKLLNRRNQPCPLCGGTDRFVYTDKFKHGNYVCRHCGAGDGFKLAEAALGLGFWDVFKRVEDLVGSGIPLQQDRKASPEFMRKVCERVWADCVPVVKGDEVDAYLANRGLSMEKYPSVLRRHPSLEYYEKGAGEKRSKVVGRFPAMVCPLQALDGNVVTLHRTYLQDGRKANVADPKKCLQAFDGGPAIQLFEPTEELAITEGIETALAVHIATGRAVWAAYSASNLEKISVPGSVKRVYIYADNDASFTGQSAAYALAKRLTAKREGQGDVQVTVFIPQRTGEDWADVVRRRQLAATA
jgi:putative DNA primase/helicase